MKRELNQGLEIQLSGKVTLSWMSPGFGHLQCKRSKEVGGIDQIRMISVFVTTKQQ